MAELAGADQITIHLREDRRHIQDRDLRIMRDTVQTRLNLEMAATDEMLEIALSVKPDTVTLVPERREEQTTEHGLDAVRLEESLRGFCNRLSEAGIDVSLFIDADLSQIDAACRLGVHAIEIHTGEYADAVDDATMESELSRIETAADHGHQAGLMVAAGHGLDYVNVREVAAIESIEELNIGHSLVSRAVLIGMDSAVREMIAKMHEG